MSAKTLFPARRPSISFPCMINGDMSKVQRVHKNTLSRTQAWLNYRKRWVGCESKNKWFPILSLPLVDSFHSFVTRLSATENETTGRKRSSSIFGGKISNIVVPCFHFRGFCFFNALQDLIYYLYVLFSFCIPEECRKSLISSTCFNFTMGSQTSERKPPISSSCFNPHSIVTRFWGLES